MKKLFHLFKKVIGIQQCAASIVLSNLLIVLMSLLSNKLREAAAVTAACFDSICHLQKPLEKSRIIRGYWLSALW